MVMIEPSTSTMVTAKLFRGLGDPTRLAILVRLLAVGEQRVVDLVAVAESSQANVSKHLACLRGCGLVTARPQGRETFYALAHPELVQLLRASDRLLELTGHDVALCADHAPGS